MTRFDAALRRLEVALAEAVTRVAELARATGFEDGRASGVSEGRALAMAEAGSAEARATDRGPDLSPLLREELEAARAREAALQDAVTQARVALDEAMDDIRTALGPV